MFAQFMESDTAVFILIISILFKMEGKTSFAISYLRCSQSIVFIFFSFLPSPFYRRGWLVTWVSQYMILAPIHRKLSVELER